ncbi:MAG: hypothetical protein ABI981_11335 [Betaproteobacteria bacterium]
MMVETALLSFALTTVVLPPQLPPKTPRKTTLKSAQVQKDPRFAEFAKGVLHCYHPTGRFQDANIVQRPWSRQAKEGAKGSAVISIEYLGVTNAHYTLVVGVLGKPQAIKAVIRSDTAVVKAYENCELNDWVAVK